MKKLYLIIIPLLLAISCLSGPPIQSDPRATPPVAVTKNTNVIVPKNTKTVVTKNTNTTITKNTNVIVPKNTKTVVTKNTNTTITKNTNVIVPKNTKTVVSKITNVRATERGNVVVPNILFENASSSLTGNYTDSLNIIKDILTANENVKIVIEGHSSIQGIASYNYELSRKRANAVYNYMIKNMNISKSKLIVKPLGEGVPENTDDSKNRRVEFVVIKNDTELNNYDTYIKNVDTRKEYK